MSKAQKIWLLLKTWFFLAMAVYESARIGDALKLDDSWEWAWRLLAGSLFLWSGIVCCLRIERSVIDNQETPNTQDKS